MDGAPKKWEQMAIAKPKYVQSWRDKGGTQLGTALQRVAEVSLATSQALGVPVASVFMKRMNKYINIP